ncbi:hypothetical protein ACRAKI_13345 [Saccharothrix isguenensis]
MSTTRLRVVLQSGAGSVGLLEVEAFAEADEGTGCGDRSPHPGTTAQQPPQL